jgi:uncharacterized membrane protein YeaQ/YmgE (transglycosylase-associated protein family)
MNILLWIVLGGLSGYTASRVMGSGHGILEDIILGIIGAFVGGALLNVFGQPGVTGFNIYSFIVAIIGAVVLIYLGRIFHRERRFHL